MSRAPEVIAARGELSVERDRHRPSGRRLLQGEMEASYIDLADVRHLEFDYLRWMRTVLRAARARRVLHLGGGACALARALADEDPEGRQDVCEADADVLEMAREHMGLRRVAGLRVRHCEGRAAVDQAVAAGVSYDAVAIDAFLGARVPPRLVTVEALATVASAAPLALVNVVDSRAARDVRTVAVALAESFAAVRWLGGRVGGNSVLVASAHPPPFDPDVVRARLAADPSPAGVVGPADLGRRLRGVAPLRDAELAAA